MSDEGVGHECSPHSVGSGESRAEWEGHFRKFTQTFSMAWSISMLLRGTGVSRETAAFNAVAKQHLRIMNAGGLRSFTAEELRSLNKKLVDDLVRESETAEQIVCITIMHVAIENFIHGMLAVLCKTHRNRVVERLSEKKISVGNLMSVGQESAVSDVLEKWLEAQERVSLLINWQTVMQLVPPKETFGDMRLPYDEEWLAKLDTARQRAVHDAGDGMDIEFCSLHSMLKATKIVQTLWAHVGLASGWKDSGSSESEEKVKDLQAIVRDVEKIEMAVRSGNIESVSEDLVRFGFDRPAPE